MHRVPQCIIRITKQSPQATGTHRKPIIEMAKYVLQVTLFAVSATALFVASNVLGSTRAATAIRSTTYGAPPATGAMLLSITLARASNRRDTSPAMISSLLHCHT
ncbi:hypothetical protein TRVL_02580 [Trypanosoma vivax]|nr:hypothetical protein TRVL_02580 [Trypanosoma vivax]